MGAFGTEVLIETDIVANIFQGIRVLNDSDSWVIVHLDTRRFAIEPHTPQTSLLLPVGQRRPLTVTVDGLEWPFAVRTHRLRVGMHEREAP